MLGPWPGGRGRPEHASSVLARLHLDTRTSAHARHCWVVDPPGRQGRWPALLLEWRRAGNNAGDLTWRGWVIFVVDLTEGWELVETWLEADYLQPLDASRATSGRKLQPDL